jgi:hypothetical protein
MMAKHVLSPTFLTGGTTADLFVKVAWPRGEHRIQTLIYGSSTSGIHPQDI